MVEELSQKTRRKVNKRENLAELRLIHGVFIARARRKAPKNLRTKNH
jgi:hypothetical protein